MKRYIVVLMVLTLLSLPLVVGAEETVIPPEANWSPTPPARPTVDLVQLVQLLVAKGVITDQEYAQLTRPQSSSPSQPGGRQGLEMGRNLSQSSPEQALTLARTLTSTGAHRGSRPSHRA